MDLGTIIGIGLGASMIVLGVLVGGTGINIYVDIPSVFITIFGSFAALMVANPLNRMLAIMSYFKIGMRVSNWELERIIRVLVEFSERARREGLLALEDNLQEIDDEFMRKGIQLVVDGTDPEIIKSVLFNELGQVQSRHSVGIKLFEDWGKLAPAFGMIGTLLGLIAMLANLADQAQVGAGMSVALITTLYGAIMANLVFIPLKSKLEEKDKDETMVKEIIIEGVLSIQSGDNPRVVLEKLVAFLPPKRREAMRQESAKD